VRNLIFTSGAY